MSIAEKVKLMVSDNIIIPLIFLPPFICQKQAEP